MQSGCYSNGKSILCGPPISGRPHSSAGLDLSLGLHPPGRQKTPVGLHYPLGLPPPANLQAPAGLKHSLSPHPPVKCPTHHEILKSGLHVHKYYFPATKRKLQTRTINGSYDIIIPITQVYTVISTPSGDVLAVVDEHSILRGIYNISRGRRKINMKEPYQVKPLTTEEREIFYLGQPLKKSDFLDLNH